MRSPHGKMEQAAILLAEDRLTDEAIAQKVGVSRAALAKWKRRPDFQTLLSKARAEFRAAVMQRGIARKDYRLHCIANRHSDLLSIIEERAKDQKMAAAPGGKTGLLVMQVRQTSSKDTSQSSMAEYSVDAGLLREIRALEEQAAKETGQVVNKSEIRRIPNLKELTDEELENLYSQLSEGAREGTDDAELLTSGQMLATVG